MGSEVRNAWTDPVTANNVDPDNHGVWRIYETNFNPTNGCLFWHEGNMVYVIMNGIPSNDLKWSP